MSLGDAATHVWITGRWAKWAPLVRVHAILTDSATDFLLIHRNRCVESLTLGLPRETVARYSLDDPRLSDAKFRSILKTAIERRRSRMGRVKGQKRERYVANRT